MKYQNLATAEAALLGLRAPPAPRSGLDRVLRQPRPADRHAPPQALSAPAAPATTSGGFLKQPDKQELALPFTRKSRIANVI
jgi:hypothetical protein